MRQIIWRKSDGSNTYRIVEHDNTVPSTLILEIIDGEDAMGRKRWKTTSTVPFLCVGELVKKIKLLNEPGVVE